MKYTALIVGREFVTISNTTCEPVETTSEQRLMDGIAGTEKYSYVNVYTKLATISGNTYAELDTKYWAFIDNIAAWPVISQHNTIDIEMVVIKHPKRKPATTIF